REIMPIWIISSLSGAPYVLIPPAHEPLLLAALYVDSPFQRRPISDPLAVVDDRIRRGIALACASRAELGERVAGRLVLHEGAGKGRAHGRPHTKEVRASRKKPLMPQRPLFARTFG